VVSYLFLFIGLIAFVEMAVHAAEGVFRFNFGILGIGIFAGLRRYSKIWRVCALLFTWYGIITVSIALLICLYGQPAPAASVNFVPANWLCIPLIMVLLVTLWQYRVLTHPAIRRLFNEEARSGIVPAAETVAAEIDGAVLKQ
jgi:hypothetical protein